MNKYRGKMLHFIHHFNDLCLKVASVLFANGMTNFSQYTFPFSFIFHSINLKSAAACIHPAYIHLTFDCIRLKSRLKFKFNCVSFPACHLIETCPSCIHENDVGRTVRLRYISNSDVFVPYMGRILHGDIRLFY